MKRLLLVACFCACLGPTEVLVDISSDFDCTTIQQTDIYLAEPDAGPTDPATTQYGCVGSPANEIGSLAIVPAHAIDEKMTIDIRATLANGTCDPPSSATCIEAKRSISYVPHERLYLPIVLHALCAGFPCGVGDTCEVRNGAATCVDDTVACSDSDAGCSLGVGDGGSGCPSPSTFTGGAPTYTWSFDSSTVAEDHGSLPTPQLATPNTFSSGDGPAAVCGAYLVAHASQTLGSLPDTPHFRVAAWTRGTTNGLVFTYYGVGIEMITPSSGTGHTLAIQQLNGSGGMFTNDKALALGDGAWHRVEAEIDGTSGTSTSYVVLLDGVTVMSSLFAAALVPSSPLLVGQGANGPTELDQVTFYALP